MAPKANRNKKRGKPKWARKLKAAHPRKVEKSKRRGTKGA